MKPCGEHSEAVPEIKEIWKYGHLNIPNSVKLILLKQSKCKDYRPTVYSVVSDAHTWHIIHLSAFLKFQMLGLKVFHLLIKYASSRPL